MLNIAIKKRDPLECAKCDGALLPMRAMYLDTGVIEYVCINCGRRWLLVDRPTGLVFVSSPQNEKDRLEHAHAAGCPAGDHG
jgi:DNA-directed RNA polymerase subunit RPC12/RpoP